MQLQNILNTVIYLVIIIALLAVAYAVVWTALFYPITQNRKHKEKVAEAQKEYNKIEVEHATIIRAKEETNDELKKLLYMIHNKEKYLEDLNKKIEASEKKASDSKSEVKKKWDSETLYNIVYT